MKVYSYKCDDCGAEFTRASWKRPGHRFCDKCAVSRVVIVDRRKGGEMGYINQALIDFADMGLFNVIAPKVCGKCQPKDDECDTCFAQKVLSSLERRIGIEGIKFMKQLVKEWASLT